MILPNVFLEIEPFGIDDGLEIGIIIFSVILFALSITAYRNTGIKKILFASAAFALFALQLFVDSINNYLGIFDENVTDILVALITFAILVLFFVAIVKKR